MYVQTAQVAPPRGCISEGGVELGQQLQFLHAVDHPSVGRAGERLELKTNSKTTFFMELHVL